MKKNQISVHKSLPGDMINFKVPVRRVPRLRALSRHEIWRLLGEFGRLPVLHRNDWRILRRAMIYRP